MTDDIPGKPEPGPDVASLAAHWYAKARERAAQPGAPPGLAADVAKLAELTGQLESLPAATEDDGDPARATEKAELLARLAEIMACVNADDPPASEFWQVIATSSREAAAYVRQLTGLA